ncbi:MAG: AmmeMemoRadiSam system protein A [bacterium]|nr:AmmeMemoRadiSam system protein A [bacterium]
MIVIGALSPHPPLLVLDPQPEILEQVQSTDSSLRDLAQQFAKAKPQRIIIMSPHAPVHPTAFPIYLTERLRGSMAQFRRPDVTLDYPIDQEFSKKLASRCAERQLRTFFLSESSAKQYGFSLDMDHGTFVPLHYLHQAGVEVPLVVLGTAGLTPQEHAQLGKVIAELIEEDGVPTAILASGDLSHRLLSSGSYGFDEKGPVFDEAITAAVRGNDLQAASAIPAETVQRAGQCGYRPIMMLLGALPQAEAHQLSYEGPFGVGYCVAYLTPARETSEKQDAAPKREDVRLTLARQAVQEYVTHHRVLEKPEPQDELAEPAPTFVTLKINGQLRGCIGTLAATCPNQQQEIIQNAISACSRDPRFKPVTPAELPLLQYQVYVLGPMEPIDSRDKLDPKRYGVVVSKGGRRGVLLPNLEGIDTVEMQLEIAARKGGISLDEDPDLYRFEVITYGE